MKKGIFTIAVLMSLAVLTASCGGSQEEGAEAPAATPGPDTLVLALEDTIGLEMGDSSYVFGMIMEARYAGGGRIAVLDMQRACLSLYSAEGAFLRTIGSPGPGPGEFQVPIDFAVMSDGGFAVADAVARNISFFDSEGAYVGMMGDFFPTPPMSIEGGPDGTFVGQAMGMVMTGQQMEASLEIAKWSDSSEADVVYMEKPMELDIQGGGQATLQRGPELDFAVGSDGSVFIAEISDTMFAVTGYSPSGEEIMSLHEEADRTPLTQEELDAGSLALSIQVVDGEASAGANRVSDVYPWRNVISSIGVDGEDRIWVEMGNLDHPFFRVYDYSGQLLFYAVTDVPFTPVSRPDFMIGNGGFLACDRDPLDYPKIFTFSLRAPS